MILLAVFGVWWALAAFERQVAIHLLNEDIAPISMLIVPLNLVLARLNVYKLDIPHIMLGTVPVPKTKTDCE